MPTACVSDIEIYYEVHGEGAQTLVMIRGLAKTRPATPARSGAMYGGGAASLDPSMVNELILAYLDASTEVP